MRPISKMKFDVCCANIERFEERANVDYFGIFGEAMAKSIGAGEDIGVAEKAFAEMLIPLFRRTRHVACFVYECGLTSKEREENSFEDFMKKVNVGQLREAYLGAIDAVFLSSPPQTTSEEVGETLTVPRSELEMLPQAAPTVTTP